MYCHRFMSAGYCGIILCEHDDVELNFYSSKMKSRKINNQKIYQ